MEAAVAAWAVAGTAGMLRGPRELRIPGAAAAVAGPIAHTLAEPGAAASSSSTSLAKHLHNDSVNVIRGIVL